MANVSFLTLSWNSHFIGRALLQIDCGGWIWRSRDQAMLDEVTFYNSTLALTSNRPRSDLELNFSSTQFLFWEERMTQADLIISWCNFDGVWHYCKGVVCISEHDFRQERWRFTFRSVVSWTRCVNASARTEIWERPCLTKDVMENYKLYMCAKNSMTGQRVSIFKTFTTSIL